MIFADAYHFPADAYHFPQANRNFRRRMPCQEIEPSPVMQINGEAVVCNCDEVAYVIKIERKRNLVCDQPDRAVLNLNIGIIQE